MQYLVDQQTTLLINGILEFGRNIRGDEKARCFLFVCVESWRRVSYRLKIICSIIDPFETQKIVLILLQRMPSINTEDDRDER